MLKDLKKYPLTIRIYFLTRIFVGLRFIIPIWVTFFLRIITFEQMALAEALVLIIGILFELPSGALADLIGRKKTTILGLIIQGSGYFLLAFGTDFDQYLIFYGLATLGGTFISGAEDALIYDSLKQVKKLKLYSEVMSIQSVIYQMTLFISTIAGGYLYNIWIYFPYIITGITLILAGLIYVFSIEPKSEFTRISWKEYAHHFKEGFLESFRNKSSSLTTFYYILVFGASFLLMAYFEQPFAKWLGFTEQEIGWIFGIIILSRVFAMFPAKFIEQKFSIRVINFILPFVPGLCMLFSYQNKFVGLFILLFENLFLGFRNIFTLKTYNRVIDSRYRASAISTASMFINLLYMVFVYGISKLLGFNNIGYSLNIVGIILIIASFVSLFLNYEKDLTNGSRQYEII